LFEGLLGDYIKLNQQKAKKSFRIGVVFARIAPCEGDGMEKLMGKNEKTCQSVNLLVFVLSFCVFTSLCEVVFGSLLASKEHKNNS
jgi:hypothetical protein